MGALEATEEYDGDPVTVAAAEAARKHKERLIAKGESYWEADYRSYVYFCKKMEEAKS